MWLGFGGLCLASSEFWEFWLAEFGRRGWVRTATNRRIHSLGPSACHRHHHVLKDIRARVHTATITRHEQRFRICASEHDASPLCDESSEWPFVSAFVPPPRWLYVEQSTHSSYHVRCVFLGWVNQQMRTTPKEHEVRREQECHKTAAT